MHWPRIFGPPGIGKNTEQIGAVCLLDPAITLIVHQNALECAVSRAKNG